MFLLLLLHSVAVNAYFCTEHIHLWCILGNISPTLDVTLTSCYHLTLHTENLDGVEALHKSDSDHTPDEDPESSSLSSAWPFLIVISLAIPLLVMLMYVCCKLCSQSNADDPGDSLHMSQARVAPVDPPISIIDPPDYCEHPPPYEEVVK